ncbi:MAG TPA: hydroxyacid dehydrogenase [Acidimicrobiia bacterium]|nr:hydroxyacid dehydrogenase [Acidimicrobiia bacterium]
MTAIYRVVATDRVSKKGLAPLRDDDRFEVVIVKDSSSPDFTSELKTAVGLVVRSATRVDAAMLDGAPDLKVVGRAGVGVDNIDVPAASERGVAVMNSPGGNTISAAELTMALMLAVARRVTDADRSIREGRWERSALRGVELRGKTLGVIGAGRIGWEVAQRCRAFGMDVIVYDPYLAAHRVEELHPHLVSLEHLIETADVITLHVPLNAETRGLIGDDALRRMKKGAFILNVSRGGVVDEAALARALHDQWIGGAGLDVYEHEPISPESPLLDAPNLVLTPHLGASTKEAQIQVALEVSRNIRAALARGDLSSAINATDLARAAGLS